MKFKKFINSRYTQVSVYVIVVAMIIMIIDSLIGNVPYLFNVALDKIGWVLEASKPIILALVFTYLLSPVVDFFQNSFMKIKVLKKNEKTCRLLAVFVVSLFVVVVVAAIISILVYSITDQIRLANFHDIIALVNQYVDSINNAYQVVMDKISEANIDSSEVKQYIQSAAAFVLDYLSTFATGVLTSITGITSFFTGLFLAFIMTIYFLIDGKMIGYHVKRIAAAMLSRKSHEKLMNFVNDADEVFSGYIRGQCSDAFCMMVMISITLSITGVKFAIVIGIFAGIGNLIPYVGPIIAYVGTVLSCLITQDMKTLMVAIIALVVIQLIDGNIIGPRLLSNAISIHPLIVIISLVFGSAIGGLLGMLLAVPVGALIKVLFMKYIDRKLESKGLVLEYDNNTNIGNNTKNDTIERNSENE